MTHTQCGIDVQLVLSEDYSIHPGSFSKHISLSSHGKGVNQLQIIADKEVINKKIVYE